MCKIMSSWLYMSEILPTKWMGYGTASSWIFTNIVGYTTPLMLDHIKFWTYEIFFAFMCFVIYLVILVNCILNSRYKRN